MILFATKLIDSSIEWINRIGAFALYELGQPLLAFFTLGVTFLLIAALLKILEMWFERG